MEYKYICDAAHFQNYYQESVDALLIAAYLIELSFGVYGVVSLLGDAARDAAKLPMVSEVMQRINQTLSTTLITQLADGVPPGEARLKLYLEALPEELRGRVKPIIDREARECMELNMRLSELNVTDVTMIRKSDGVLFKVTVDVENAPLHSGPVTVALKYRKRWLNIKPLRTVLLPSRVHIIGDDNDLVAFTSMVENRAVEDVVDEEVERMKADLFTMLRSGGGCVPIEKAASGDDNMIVLDGDFLILPPIVRAKMALTLGGTRASALKKLVSRRGGTWYARCKDGEERCIKVPSRLIEELLGISAKMFCDSMTPEELDDEVIT